MNNKILVFESKNLSYDSSNCFLKIICKELEIQGFEVEYCRIEALEGNMERLLSYIGKSYLAILDINSNLSLAVHDGKNDYYLNLIDAPFYNFLVDHPMHMHEKLNVQLKDYHVICLDKYHASYIRENYPHIKDVIVMPYGGIAAEIIDGTMRKSSMIETEDEFKSDFKKRPMDIAFPATYMPEDYYLNALKEEKPGYDDIAINMLELLEKSEKMTIEEAYKCVCTDSGKLLKQKDDKCEVGLHEIRLIDRYIRAYLRNKAITELLKSKMRVHVIGANWGLYDGKDKDHLIIHEQVSYDMIPELMLNTKVLFNTQPLFMDGPHDRVMNAVINGAAALTDECDYLRKHFNHNVDIVFYHRNNMEILPRIVESLFTNQEKLVDIAWRGYQKALEKHTWHIRVDWLIKHIIH